MFEGCVSVTSCSQLFYYCSQLKVVPKGIFDDLIKMETIDWGFSYCQMLEVIRIDLFDNQRYLQSCRYVFQYCGKLTIESPYTLIDGVKVHLYERKDYPDYFITPIAFEDAFSLCSNMADYSLIPSEWK
jgi:hypothetical protein